jgi:hypothetical protein
MAGAGTPGNRRRRSGAVVVGYCDGDASDRRRPHREGSGGEMVGVMRRGPLQYCTAADMWARPHVSAGVQLQRIHNGFAVYWVSGLVAACVQVRVGLM